MTSRKKASIPSKVFSKLKEWHLKKPGFSYGPFSYLEIIQMLQEKVILPTDSLRRSPHEAWMPICDWASFQSGKLSDLRKNLPDDLKNGIFFKRQHTRAKYGCSLIVHDNKSIFKGESIQISAGGAGLVVDADHLKPGHTLLIHFQPGGGVPPFNAVCKVVSKLPTTDARENAPTKYGVVFTSISSKIREQIKTYAETTQQRAVA